MKKLMKTMASAAVALLGFGAFADLPSPSATFEGLTTGEKTVSALVDNDDAGSSEGDKYWFAVTNDSQTSDTVIGVVTNETGRGNYFAMDTSAPLYRTINSTTTQSGSDFANAAEAETIGSDGIYLDTMVKFTPSEELFKDDDLEASVDKLAISYVENDEGITGIVVRAGYVGSSVVATNYVMTLPANFDVDAWHQLTVRAIADVGSSTAPVGFAVYLDQVLLTYGTEVAAGDSDYVGALNAAVTQNLYKEGTHALLPSLVTTGVNKSKLTAVGFKGTGSLDNIQFTNVKPSFIVEGIAVSIAWDAGVASYTVVDSNDKTLVDAAATSGAAGSTNLTLDAGVTALTVTATYATGYESGTWTVTGEGAQISGSTFTVANGAELSIVSMLPKFDVGGTHYGTFEKALEAAVASETTATIKLMANISETISFSTGNIVLDLCGMTIQGGDNDDYTINNNGATLTITNSVTGGEVMAPTKTGATSALYTDDGSTTIDAGKFSGTIFTEKMLDPEAPGAVIVNGGSFYDPDYDPADQESAFYLKPYLADGVTASYSEGYFTVGAAQPEPTKIAVPTAASNLVYDGAEKTGVEAGEGYTLSGDFKATNAGEYTATATLEDGYIWSDDTNKAKDINWSIAAKTDADVVVTLTSQIAEYTTQLAFPTASATIGNGVVEGTPTWNPAEITEPNAGETNTYTVTFTVTTANYAGSTGTAEFKVWKAKSEEPEYPSYIDDNVAYKDAYDQWKTENSVAAGDNQYVDAFLLNIAPDATDQTLEPASITMEGGKVVISANQTLTAVNGKVYVKVATTLAGLASAEWTEVTLNEGKVQVTPGSSDTAGFYKIKVDF